MTTARIGLITEAQKLRIYGLTLLALCGLCGGCFTERSNPFQAGDYQRIPAVPAEVNDTREWLVFAHRALEGLLPPQRAPALLTGQLVGSDGQPVDVHRHFGRTREELPLVTRNFTGLLHSAQGAGAEPYAVGEKPPPWEGFEDIWIPVRKDFELHARLGLARDADGIVQRADCILILGGLFGDLAVGRSRDIAEALRVNGLHACVVEMRGHGQTERRYPAVPYNFGPLETEDLLAASAELRSLPAVRETGLIGFCWGANHALYAAWATGRGSWDPAVARRIQAVLRSTHGEHEFRAGIMAFSATLHFEQVIAMLRYEWGLFQDPVLNNLQDSVRERKRLKGYDEQSGDLRALIEAEYARSLLDYPGAMREGLDYLRLLPYEDRPVYDKVSRTRVPVLIVHGEDDPMGPAQDVADFMAITRSRDVAAIVLPGGGHVGFAAYARAHFYSLMLNFFDPERGAAACVARRRRANAPVTASGR